MSRKKASKMLASLSRRTNDDALSENAKSQIPIPVPIPPVSPEARGICAKSMGVDNSRAGEPSRETSLAVPYSSTRHTKTALRRTQYCTNVSVGLVTVGGGTGLR